MASVKYGCLDPDPKTKMYPVAASQYFYHEGCNAVIVDDDGNIRQLLTLDETIFGVAIVPAGRGAGASDSYWLSSATAGADKIPVVMAISGYTFLFPSDATITESMKGNACDIVAVNDGTATYVAPGTGTEDVFTIEDLGINVSAKASATDIVVKLNLNNLQSDT